MSTPLDPNLAHRLSTLLAIAEQQQGQPEGDNAMNMATKIMAERCISRAMLDSATGRQQPVRTTFMDLPAVSYGELRAKFVLGVANVFGVASVFQTWRGDTGRPAKYTLILVGYPDDLDTVVSLGHFLLAQLDTLIGTVKNSSHYTTMSAAVKRSFLTSTVVAWDARVLYRLAVAYGAAKTEATPDPNKAALVLAERKTAAETALAQKMGDQKPGKVLEHRAHNARGARLGDAAATNTDIGLTRLHRHSPARAAIGGTTQ